MDLNEIEKNLKRVLALLQDERNLPDSRVLRSNDPDEVREVIAEKLPETSESFEQLMQDFQQSILPYLNRNTEPGYGAYITGSGNAIGPIAEFIKGYFNQNGLKWNNSPVAAEMEQLVVSWVSEFVDLPDHRQGMLTSGGSMSNYLAMHFALHNRYPEIEKKGMFGLGKVTVYCSTQTHSSIDRAMVFLGLGTDQLRKIPVNGLYGIDIAVLKTQIEADLTAGFQPLMVIGNAGTTNTGSIDNLQDLADLAENYNLWYHVDGAYGLPARRLPEMAHYFEGVERADSVIVNPHKWLYVPFEAGCLMLKNLEPTIHLVPDYLFTENPGSRWESSTYTIELSKEFRALKVWFTLKYYGADQLAEFIRKDIDQIDRLAEALDKIENVVVDPNHPTSILCFRYFDPALSEEENERVNIETLRLIESEGRIFITGTRLHGFIHLRVYYGNPERKNEDVVKMASVIRESFEKVIKGIQVQ